MEENRKDTIVYDENWQTLDTPVLVTNANEEESVKDENAVEPKREKSHRFPALITVQLILCLILAFVVFLLKSMGSDAYHSFSSWYEDMMQDTLMPNSEFEDIDLSGYFSATADQAATNDEV